METPIATPPVQPTQSIESLFAEIESAGWTVSWAFQFQPGHWRVSILREDGAANTFRHCADAPTFALALEYAFIRGEEFTTEDEPPTYSLAPKQDLLATLGLGGPKERIERR